MNYRELYEQARALQATREEIFRDEGSYIRDEKKDAEASKLARTLGGFIPTGIAALDRMVRALNPRIVYGTSNGDPNEPPNFDPPKDTIHLPAPASFSSMQEYAHVLTHELSHWTRGPDRLPRLWHKAVDDDKEVTFQLNVFTLINGDIPAWTKAVEELVAEVSASIIGERLGFGSPGVSRRYIRAWLENFKDDVSDMPGMERWLELAGKDGERAAAWLLEKA